MGAPRNADYTACAHSDRRALHQINEDGNRFMNRRNFLAGLFAVPAIVKLDMLMPIRVWRPIGYFTRNIGMGPFVAFRTDDLIGLDLDMPMGSFASAPGQSFIGLHQRSAALLAAATNRRIVALDRAAMREVRRLVALDRALPDSPRLA